MRTKTLPRGFLLYKRSFKAVRVLPKKGFTWFALEHAYGSNDTYGPIISTWKVTRPLRLLQISTMRDRAQLAKRLHLPVSDLTCDLQYAGGAHNKTFHERIASFLHAQQYDGTYISEKDADEDCDGATEVVLHLSRGRPVRRV